MANNNANDIDAAKKKYDQYRSCDPFPDIAPALLNSADIEDYVNATGAIVPFDGANLKSASYEVPFGGLCFRWNEDGRRHEQTISPGDSYLFPPNSITFVQPDVRFQLPDYLAVRFNLSITHVHRGLLLGTGPLVDPGFVGRLLIPIHNLTTNEYYVRGGCGLIWCEFTKVSSAKDWVHSKQTEPLRTGTYRSFPDNKRNLDWDRYIQKSAQGSAIKSSVGGFVASAEAAEDSAKRAESQVKFFVSTTYLAGTLTFIGLVITLISFFTLFLNPINSQLDELEMRIDSIESHVEQ